MLLPTLAAAEQAAQPQAAAFDQVWQRADYPVAASVAKRSWLWGPLAMYNTMEPLVESPGGMRQVRYYDKSRMEINDPNGDPNSPWFVTNGLLVVEMISGHMQVGVNTFEPREPAGIAVAGDVRTAGAVNFTPTYAALGGVATINISEHRALPRPGQDVRESLSADGAVTNNTPPHNVGKLPKMQQYETVTGHNIPDVFWSFMNQRGTVYENGAYHEGELFNWLYAMGYPITEPYWITVEIAGKRLPVMMQAFQRRILTYNPDNAQQWQVEMGNVGMQYHQWRYPTNPSPQPNPSPAPDATPLKFKHVEGDVASQQFSAIHDPLYTAINKQEDWEALWKRHSIQMNPNNVPPSVDFKTEFVVAAFWGDKPDSCYGLNITGVSVSGTTMVVNVSRTQVDKVCLTVITQPHDFAVVSKAGLPQKTRPQPYDVIFRDGNTTINTTQVTLP
jgi:hypothetical protein